MRKPTVLVAFVAVVFGALGGVAVASHEFSDVPDSHPFHDDIAWMAEEGITEGFGDGTFRPGQPVTRQAMSAFMRRLAGADPEVGAVVDARSVEGRDIAELEVDRFRTGGTGPFVVTGTTPATATTVLPGVTSVETIAQLTAVVDTSYDSSLLTCLYGDAPIPGMIQLKIGDATVGYSDRVSVTGQFVAIPADLSVRCYVQNAVGTGTIELENLFLWAIED